MSTKKFREKSHLKLKFSASASNLQICSSPQYDLIDGYFGKSQTTFKNMFRLKRLNNKTLQKRNTFGSLWDLRSCTNYKISLGSPCESAILPGERPKGKVEKPSRGRNHSVRLLKSQSLKLLNSFSSCEEKYLRRLKSLWNYKSRCNKMLEARRAKVIMPWGNASLDVLIEHKSLTRDLVDTVASKCKLLERSYFGLAFRDSTTNQLNWLQLDKRVLDYDLPRSRGFIVLHFAVRFFVDTYARLQTSTALELLYLQSKEHVFKGDLECSDEDAFKLAALVLQETCGDYTDDESTKKIISKYPLLPSFVLQKHPSINYCEKKILDYYKSLTRNTRGLVIVGFLSIVESLPSYGTHYYLVKDRDGLPWWLGMNRRGISVYDYNDRSRPRKWFKWESIENIFYRDKKFCLEVYNSRRVSNKADISNLYDDATRDTGNAPDDLSAAIAEPTTQVSISKRVYGPSTVDVHHWVCASAQLTESVWSMAVSQHKFSVEMSLRSPDSLRSNDEIVRELNSSAPLFNEPGWTDHSQPATDLALETKKILSSTGSDVLEKAKQQLKTLKEKKLVLNDNLTSKLRELKRLCLEEANLVGEMPKEYPLEAGESMPKVKKRVGTSYSLCPNVINNSVRDSGEISKEVLEYELQDKITKAALVLAQEEKIPKNIRKSRIESYHKEWKKLKAMESNLKQMAKHKRSKDESIKKLRSMAEPSAVLPLGDVEPKNRRSLETLNSIPQQSHNSEENSRGRLKSARQDHFNAVKHPSNLIQTPGSSSCRHKSAPSSPTLPRHSEQHNRQQYNLNFPKQKGGFACHDHERHSTSKSVNKYGLPIEHQRLMVDNRKQHNLSQHSFHSFANNVNHFGYFPLNVVGPYHAGVACPSTSFVIPLSADPRITSRNFAAGYGLLTCETPIPRVQPRRWGSENYDSSSQESGYSGRYQSQMLTSRGTDQLLNHFSRMHVGENLCRYKSDSSSTLSSSSGGASGSTSSCNKLFTKSSAYPTPSQIGSFQQVPSDFINTSDSSMTSFNDFEQQVAPEARSYFLYKRWNENTLARAGSDYLDRAPSSRDSGYEATSQGVSSTPPVQCFGPSRLHPINPLPCQGHSAYKREMSKPFETSDISKYSETQRIITQSLDFRRLHGHPDHLSSGSFSSTSSIGSLSRGSTSSSLHQNNSRSLHYNCNSSTYPDCNQAPQVDGRKDVTLTRENVGDYYQEFVDEPASRTALLSSSISRSRKPILYGSDVSVELLMRSTSNNKLQGIERRQGMSDSTDDGSAKESSFNSFPFEAKVSQEFEDEMLQWYEMCGISPQPDDKFTLV